MHTDQGERGLDIPQVSVVVASHGRAERLAMCLEALAGQTLDPERWELIVVHTYDDSVAEHVLDGSELGRAGRLRHLRVDPAATSPARQRNIGWRAARASIIAFTDDDCRPEKDWLARLLDAARANPDAFVQGATRHDPREAHLLQRAHIRTLAVEPPGRFTQTCNVLYRRETLERLDGFDEVAITGEDIDLGIRAQELGAPLVAARDAVVYHAVEEVTLREKLRSNRKWEHLAYVVKKHPRLREQCDMRVWWKREHWCAALAVAGAATAVARRRPLIGVGAAIPYFTLYRDRYGHGTVGRLRVVRRFPELCLIDLAEIAVFVRGSLRYRTLLL